MPRYPHFALALLAVLASSPGHAAIFSVGPASAGSCTHEFLVLAIEAARVNPGPDEIRVTIAAGQAADVNLSIDNQQLTLLGGFPDCAAAQPTGRTLLGGAGSLAAPVLAIRSTAGNSVDVTLEGFDLVGGDNSTSTPGGGLRIGASGTVRIRHCRIANNTAIHGGGIGIQGNSLDDTHVVIGDDVRIEDNQTANFGAGGGLYISQATVTLGGLGTVVRRNRATNGGGVAPTAGPGILNARLDIRSGGEGSNGIVSENTATSLGGGVHLAGAVEARLYTSDETRPLRLDRNRAGDGGAMAATASGSRVAIWEGLIEQNEASRAGGAFMLHPTTMLTVSSAEAADAPADAVACAAANPCNRVVGNRSNTTVPWHAAVLSLLVDPNSSTANAHFDSTVFSGNRGATLFAEWCEDRVCPYATAIRLRNSLIAENPDAAGVAILEAGGIFECDLCTIAESGALSAAPLFDTSGPLTLTRSIVFDPGRDIIGGRTPQSVDAAHLLVHDASDFGAAIAVVVDNPFFVAPGGGNYRLTVGSPALDRALVLADAPGFGWSTPSLDLDREARVVDQVDVPDLAGPVDLGAYEFPDPNAIFDDGFE